MIAAASATLSHCCRAVVCSSDEHGIGLAGGDDAGQRLDERLHAPQASAGKVNRLHVVCPVLCH